MLTAVLGDVSEFFGRCLRQGFFICPTAAPFTAGVARLCPQTPNNLILFGQPAILPIIRNRLKKYF